MKVQLLTTQGCHLCEEALQLLQALQDQTPSLEIEPVEIADSAGLMEEYGSRIPVVQVAARTHDLGWPFDATQLRCFLYDLSPSGSKKAGIQSGETMNGN